MTETAEETSPDILVTAEMGSTEGVLTIGALCFRCALGREWQIKTLQARSSA